METKRPPTTTDREPMVFTEAEIVPIPAICKRGHNWTGRDAIRAPSLRNCLCFWCGTPLRPHPEFPPVVDALTRRLGKPVQTSLFT